MQSFNLENFTKGWFVGDFEPNVVKTDKFEVGVKKYASGDEDEKHYHKIAKEITVIVSGKFEMNGKVMKEGDIMVIEPGEQAEFKCLEDGYSAVVKIPSVKNDKYPV